MKKSYGFFCAVLAAALYALSTPFSKWLMAKGVPPAMMAALLYLGAGVGMAAIKALDALTGRGGTEKKLERGDGKYLVLMVLLDIAAPILMMLGLETATAANASLLNNFEIVATSVIALCLFQEKISRRLWVGIGLVTLSSMMLSLEESGSLSFSSGSLLVLSACVCWGVENNCTRRLSGKNPRDIVLIKGLGSGGGALLVAFLCGEARALPVGLIALSMLLGVVAYGLSIFFYIRAQRDLGAARTSACYAVAPFIAAGLSMLLFSTKPTLLFLIALCLMAAGAYLTASDARRAG